MTSIESLQEAVDYLLQHTSDLTRDYQLERMQTLLHFLGNPQNDYRSVHIAGTSGKTSTSYFISALLQAAGKKTGLTVSPHIVAVNERVQVGGVPLEEATFLEYFNEFLPLVEQSGETPTYFESLVAFAFWVFAKEKVDYAVIETGLGGLLDGTNTMARSDKVCVITNIGLDHTHILGDTIEKIAFQKAGIIQPGNYVLARSQQESIMRVLRSQVDKQGAVSQEVTDTAAPAFLPEFQQQNWAMARAAYEYLRTRDSLPVLNDEQQEAAAHHTPPGRGEVYKIGNKTLILDGAHNPQKIQALLHSLQCDGYTSAAVLATIIEAPDSKLDQCIAALAPYASHWIVPEFSIGQDIMNRHSFAADQVVAHTTHHSVEKITDIHAALRALLARPEDTLLVTGSLYLVSLLRPAILDLQSK